MDSGRWTINNGGYMDPSTRALIELLHAAPYRCVLALTGGGTMAAAQLLNVPGGSRTILEIQVPYSEPALVDFLGRRPEHFCSVETGRLLASRAYERALWLMRHGSASRAEAPQASGGPPRLAEPWHTPGEPVIGVGVTASLATDRPKRGDHRLHVATCSASEIRSYSLVLTKGARDRP